MTEWEKHVWNICEMAVTEIDQFLEETFNQAQTFTEDLHDSLDEMVTQVSDLVATEIEDLSEVVFEILGLEFPAERLGNPEEALPPPLTSREEESTATSLNSLENLEEPYFYFTRKVEPSLDYHPACIHCQHYHGHVYNQQLLVCGMHPYGWDDDSCPDWQERNS